ncbi:MAG: hypothetical protein ACYTF7_11525 [Planctomycetota bacterium]
MKRRVSSFLLVCASSLACLGLVYTITYLVSGGDNDYELIGLSSAFVLSPMAGWVASRWVRGWGPAIVASGVIAIGSLVLLRAFSDGADWDRTETILVTAYTLIVTLEFLVMAVWMLARNSRSNA